MVKSFRKKVVAVLLLLVMLLGLLPNLACAEETVPEGTDSFSYTLESSESVPLADILTAVGLTGEITAAQASNDAVFSVSDESGEWVLTPKQAITAAEWLQVTIADVDYKIALKAPRQATRNAPDAQPLTSLTVEKQADGPGTFHFQLKIWKTENNRTVRFSPFDDASLLAYFSPYIYGSDPSDYIHFSGESITALNWQNAHCVLVDDAVQTGYDAEAAYYAIWDSFDAAEPATESNTGVTNFSDFIQNFEAFYNGVDDVLGSSDVHDYIDIRYDQPNDRIIAMIPFADRYVGYTGAYDFFVYEIQNDSDTDYVTPSGSFSPVLDEDNNGIADDGRYSFSLSNGASVTIPDLPYGYRYEVIEEEMSGWNLVSKTGDTGILTEDCTASFVNEKNYNLTVKKETVNNTVGRFNYKVKFDHAVYFPYQYAYELRPVNEYYHELRSVVYYTNRMYKFYRAGAESKGFFIQLDAKNGSATSMWPDSKEEWALSSNLFTDEDVLYWDITAPDEAAQERQYGECVSVLTIELKNGVIFRCDINDPYRDGTNRTEYNSYDFEQLKFLEYTFKLRNGQSIVLNNIIKGTNYQVYEETQDGWELIEINGSENFPIPASDTVAGGTVGTMTAHQTDNFKNTPLFNLSFSKTVTGNMGDQDKAFRFTVKVWGDVTVPEKLEKIADVDVTADLPEQYCVFYDGVSYKGEEFDPLTKYYYGDGLSGSDLVHTFVGSITDYNPAIGTVELEGKVYYKFETPHELYQGVSFDGVDAITTYTYVSEDDVCSTSWAGMNYYYPDTSKRITLYMIVPMHTRTDYLDLSSWGGTNNGDGTFTFWLPHDNTILIPEIPYRYEYEIVEDDYAADGYRTFVGSTATESRSASGTLTADVDVNFINDKTAPVPSGWASDTKPWQMGILLSILLGGLYVWMMWRQRRQRDGVRRDRYQWD